MSPLALLGLGLLTVLVVTAAIIGISLVFGRPKRQSGFSDPPVGGDFGYRETNIGRNATSEPAPRREYRHHDTDPYIAFERIKREPTFGKRPVGKLSELSAPYTGKPPTTKPTVFLTPSMIERVNVERRRNGKPPLNRVGVLNAIAHAWDQPRRQPDTTSNWLTYLIVYEVFISDHQQLHCSGVGGIIIDPNQPYNGQGGEFAGAGASGDWTSAPVAVVSTASAIAVGAGVAYAAGLVTDNDPKYAPGDKVGGYDNAPSSINPDADAVVNAYQRSDAAFDTAPAKPDPTPSAPDPSPAAAPSNDSGGGGGDGGGGGGGGD